MVVWLLPYSNLLFVQAVVLALRILRVIDSCHSVRVAALNQSIHSLFSEPIYCLEWMLFTRHGYRISGLKFDGVTLEFEVFIRIAS